MYRSKSHDRGFTFCSQFILATLDFSQAKEIKYICTKRMFIYVHIVLHSHRL